MTAEQVRDLLHHLVARRQVHGQPRRDPSPGHYITNVAGDGSHVAITFVDGTRARIDISMQPPGAAKGEAAP